MGELYESITELLIQRLEPPAAPPPFLGGPSALPSEDTEETPIEDANQTADVPGLAPDPFGEQMLTDLRQETCRQVEDQFRRKEAQRAYSYGPKAVSDAKKAEDA